MKLNDLSQNVQNRRSGEKDNFLYDTYQNSVMPHGCHIYATPADTPMAKMYAYPPYQHEFIHWKCVLRFCSDFPRIYLSEQESDMHHSNASPSIIFLIYHLIEQCKVYGIRPIDENNIFCLCFKDIDTVTNAKIYIQKRACYDGDIH